MNIDALLREVAKRNTCSVSEIEWYSWPEVFSTTAGPRGVGGNTITAHQVYAFDAPGMKVRYCCGEWKRWSGEFKETW